MSHELRMSVGASKDFYKIRISSQCQVETFLRSNSNASSQPTIKVQCTQTTYSRNAALELLGHLTTVPAGHGAAAGMSVGTSKNFIKFVSHRNVKLDFFLCSNSGASSQHSLPYSKHDTKGHLELNKLRPMSTKHHRSLHQGSVYANNIGTQHSNSHSGGISPRSRRTAGRRRAVSRAAGARWWTPWQRTAGIATGATRWRRTAGRSLVTIAIAVDAVWRRRTIDYAPVIGMLVYKIYTTVVTSRGTYPSPLH